MRLSRLIAVAATVALAPLAVIAQSTPAAPAAPAAAAAAAPAASPSPNLVAAGDIMATLKSSPDFTILTKALEDTSMSGVLAATPGLTLFAPTDRAFKALPPAQLAALLDPKNAPLLQKILTYHLVHLELDTAKFKGAKGPVQSVESDNLQLDGSGTPLKVDDANIIEPDVKATNGLIQVIDKVLVPAGLTLPTENAQAAPTAVAPTGPSSAGGR